MRRKSLVTTRHNNLEKVADSNVQDNLSMVPMISTVIVIAENKCILKTKQITSMKNKIKKKIRIKTTF